MSWMPEGVEPDTSDLPGPREIRKLDRLAGLLALVGPVEKACRDVLKYWQPLLPACQRGETPVPRQRLRTEQARAAALVVMMLPTVRKSGLRAVLSVSVAWSITWSRMLNRSGWAFSISSSTSTEWGFLTIASVSSPPWSKPT